MSKRSHLFILFCASWNVFYLSVCAYLDQPVLAVRRILVPPEVLLPLFIWLVHGLAHRKYSTWILGLAPPFWFGFRIFPWIGLILGGGPELIVPRSFLGAIGTIGVPLNLLMGIFLLRFQEFFTPDIWERFSHPDDDA